MFNNKDLVFCAKVLTCKVAGYYNMSQIVFYDTYNQPECHKSRSNKERTVKTA